MPAGPATGATVTVLSKGSDPASDTKEKWWADLRFECQNSTVEELWQLDNELETQRYRIEFWSTLNQAVSVLIPSEKWPFRLSPSRRKLLINPPTTGYGEKWPA